MSLACRGPTRTQGLAWRKGDPFRVVPQATKDSYNFFLARNYSQPQQFWILLQFKSIKTFVTLAKVRIELVGRGGERNTRKHVS